VAAPKGNQFAKGNKGPHGDRPWADALRRAIVQSDGKTLRRLADAIVAKAADGDVAALKEIGDRLDGKAHQAISAQVDSSVTVVINKFAD
jgi:hypothetical protein